MSQCIHVQTNADAEYPGYINFSREDDGSVTVHLRGDPSTVEGRYVCGYAGNFGQPGRCTPGDEHCNNYCNSAPEKGPMQDAPERCVFIKAGETVALILSAEAFTALIAGLNAEPR